MSATNIVGTDAVQTITADANDVQLWGEGGADTINGNGLGNLIGGGNDSSGRAKDILNGLGGADILLIQTGDDELNGGSGHDIARFANYRVIDTVVMVGPVPIVTDRNGFETETVLPVQFPNFFEAVFSLDNANKFRVGTFDILDTSLGFTGISGSNSKPNTSAAATSTNLGLMTVSSIQ
jgi:Ca2+-binding RTX toxin-like protein